MNTVTRELPQRSSTLRLGKKKVWQTIQVSVLFLVVLLLAIAVVYVKDLHRRLFIQQQNLQMAQNQILVEWGKLLLEQSTWSTQARVQSISEQRLNMEVPKSSDVVMIQQ